MITQSKDFLNNIHFELQEFLGTKQGDKDDLVDIWYALDYNDVENTVDSIESGNLENRPIIHSIENDLPFHNTYDSTNNGEVQHVSVNFTFYTIINESYNDGYKRKQVLNSIASDIKYKFDNYQESLPHFRNLRVNLPDGMLSRDADGIYSCRQELYAEIFKKVR